MTDSLHPDQDRWSDADRVVDGPLLAFHDQLVAAIDAQSDESNVRPVGAAARHRRVQWVAAAAAVVLVVVGITFAWVGGDSGDVAADVTVRRDGDQVTVLVENDVDVEELADELRAAGVDVTVTPVATGPSRVNLFVGIIGPPSARLDGGDGSVSNRATFVAGSKVELQIGVLGDGPYDSATDAFADGEALEGKSLVGQTIADAGDEIARRAASSGATVSYLQPSGERTTDAPADGTVLSAQGIARGEVMIIVQP